MKIGVSSAVFYPELAETGIKRLLNCGFDTFEFFYNCDEEISRAFIEKINTLRSNADFISIHPYTAFAEGVLLFSEYARRTEEALDKYKRSFETASQLGVKYFTLHGERLHGNPQASENGFSDRSAEVLTRLAEAAKENGIMLCLENVCWCKSSGVDYISSAYENVRDLGFTLDLKQARRSGISYLEYMNAMGDRLMNIHISDFDEAHDCILPGRGKFDFRKFKEELSEIKYKGDLLIEVYSGCFSDVSEIVASKNFLEEIFA